MKKVLILFGFVLISMFSFTSCEPDCADCRIYTIDTQNGDTTNISAPEEYCGEDLYAVDGKSETDNQGIKTEYVCD